MSTRGGWWNLEWALAQYFIDCFEKISKCIFFSAWLNISVDCMCKSRVATAHPTTYPDPNCHKEKFQYFGLLLQFCLWRTNVKECKLNTCKVAAATWCNLKTQQNRRNNAQDPQYYCLAIKSKAFLTQEDLSILIYWLT